MTAVYAVALVTGFVLHPAVVAAVAVAESVRDGKASIRSGKSAGAGRLAIAGLIGFGLGGMSATFAGWPVSAAVLGGVGGVLGGGSGRPVSGRGSVRRIALMLLLADIHGAAAHLRAVATSGEPLVVLGDLINFIDYRTCEGIVTEVAGREVVSELVDLRTAGRVRRCSSPVAGVHGGSRGKSAWRGSTT